ncbi:MAG: glycosyltransferase, partial [Actinomycetota bacterium]|nr:glycosyltransferase [Actinomycetota bacterium]
MSDARSAQVEQRGDVDRPLVDVVVPSIGRPSLERLLDGLDHELADHPGLVGCVVVVDDRPAPDAALQPPPMQHARCTVVRGPARGPAAARNAGWQRTTAPWVVFLDDDVEVGPGWAALLATDLRSAPSRTVAVQAQIEVPLDGDRPPDDVERGVAQLADAAWITADMAVRRVALAEVGGFDERFPRAYREDTDLALRLSDAGGRLAVGRRTTRHPVRPTRWTECLGRQRGNADDALMR